MFVFFVFACVLDNESSAGMLFAKIVLLNGFGDFLACAFGNAAEERSARGSIPLRGTHVHTRRQEKPAEGKKPNRGVTSVLVSVSC